MTTVLLGVSGSIAAYKSADIINRLRDQAYDVHVMMTQSSTKFITPLTLQALSHNHVSVDVMDEPVASAIAHIDLAKAADVFLLAPASANTIAKLAHGFADDMISTTVLALGDIPKLIAPAMNTQMYLNPVVQANLKTLENYGWTIIDPRTSLLACGDYGTGSLADVATIVNSVIQAVTAS